MPPILAPYGIAQSGSSCDTGAAWTARSRLAAPADAHLVEPLDGSGHACLPQLVVRGAPARSSRCREAHALGVSTMARCAGVKAATRLESAWKSTSPTKPLIAVR